MPGSCTSRARSRASSLRIWSATRSGRDPWDMLRDDRDSLLHEHLDEVADLDVVEPLEADAALEPGLDLADIVFEAAERSDLAFVHKDVVAEQARLRLAAARDAALGDQAAGDGAVLGHLERISDLGHAQPDFLELRVE